MKKQAGQFAFLGLLWLGMALADQITLKNGDRVTGSIVKKDGGSLIVKTAAMGTLTIAWDQVAGITSAAPLTIVLKDKTEKATLGGGDGKIELKESQQTVTAADVQAIRDADEEKAWERLQHPNLGELWTGTGVLGFAGTAGNAETETFTVAANAARVTNTDKTAVYFSAIRASASAGGVDSDTARAVRGGWAYNHNVSPRLFLNVTNDYEYDKFQSLDLRVVIGGGGGFIAWNTKRGRLDLSAGGDYDHDKFSASATQAAFTRGSGEFNWGDNFNFKLNGTTTLTQNFRMYDNLSDTGQYRMNFGVNANTKLKKWLTWNLSVVTTYLSNPAAGRKTDDIIYSTGIGVTFAH